MIYFKISYLKNLCNCRSNLRESGQNRCKCESSWRTDIIGQERQKLPRSLIKELIPGRKQFYHCTKKEASVWGDRFRPAEKYDGKG